MKAKDLVGKLVTSNYLESRRIFPSGATFKVVCANSQNVTTLRTMPSKSLSSPLYVLATVVLRLSTAV